MNPTRVAASNRRLIDLSLHGNSDLYQFIRRAAANCVPLIRKHLKVDDTMSYDLVFFTVKLFLEARNTPPK